MRRHKSQTRDDIYLCDVAGARGRAETFGRLDLGRGPRVPVGAAGRAGGREGCSGVRGPRGIRTSGSPYPSATSRAPPCSLAFLPSFSAPGPGMLNTSPTRPARRRLREYVRASLEVRGRAGRRPPVSVRQFSDNLGAILVGNT
jgi:hypothetical protein